MREAYPSREVAVVIVDVMESEEVVRGWAGRWGFQFPVLLDRDGRLTEQFAPEGVLPDLPRNQVPIASNLLLDRDGRIRFFSLLDTNNFDARLVALRARLDELLDRETR